MRWLMETLTAILRIVVSKTGSSQLGFRTMSSKVAFGEKKTPIARPTGLTTVCGCACASGIGVGVVAIEDSSTTRFGQRLLDWDTHGNRRKFQRGGL